MLACIQTQSQASPQVVNTVYEKEPNTWIRCKFKKIIYNMIQVYFVQEVVEAVKPVHYEQST